MTHDECRKAVCFFCLTKKAKGKMISPLPSSLVDFILRGIFPDFETKQQFLPDACCVACKTRVHKFMKREKEESEVFVNNIHNSRYISISNELQDLSADNLDCSCSICSIARERIKNKSSLSDVARNSGNIDTPAQIESNIIDMCLDCYSRTSPDLPHTCNRSTRVKNLEKQLSPHTKNKLALSTIKEAK